MPHPAPTVDEVLADTCCAVLWGSGVTLHRWHVEGGVIEVPASQLRPALEAAYDPSMPDWVALIGHDGDGFFVA